MQALSPTASSRRRLLLAAVCAGFAGCGGGGGGDASGGPVIGVLGNVAAELQGDRTGLLNGQLARLAPDALEVSGTVMIEGNTFDFRAPVDANDQFSTRVERPRLAEGLSSAPASSLVLAGKVEVFSLTESPYTVTGTFQWQVPPSPTLPMQGPTTFNGTIQPPRLPNNGGNDSDDSGSDSGAGDFDESGLPLRALSRSPGAR